MTGVNQFLKSSGTHAIRNIIGARLPMLIVLSILCINPFLKAGNDTAVILATSAGSALALLIGFAFSGRVAMPIKSAFLVWATVAYLASHAAQLLPFGAVAWPGFHPSARPSGLSLSREATLLSLVQVAGYVMFFSAAVQAFSNVSRRAWSLRFSALILCVHAVFAIAAAKSVSVGGVNVDQAFTNGSFAGRNAFATFMAMGAALVSALVFGATTEREARLQVLLSKTLLLSALFLILLALLMTGSRMGFAAGLSGLSLCVTLQLRHKDRRKVVVVLGILVLLVIAIAGATTFTRVSSIPNDARLRWDLYTQIAPLILDRVFLGYGAGTFQIAFEMVQSPGLISELIWIHAHSTYLGNWVELGLFAGTLPILIFGFLFRTAMRNAWARSSVPAIAFCGALFACALHSAVDFSLEIPANMHLLLFLAACAHADMNTSETGPEK